MLMLTTWQDVQEPARRHGQPNGGTREFTFHGPAGMFRFIQENGLDRFEVRPVEFVEPHDA